MGTIANKLDNIENCKENIRVAIESKGVECSVTEPLKSYADKVKAIPQGSNITVDEVLDSTSTNPVQNKTVYEALNAKVPNSRKINNKALTDDIKLTADDVSAIGTSKKGVAGGVAELNSSGKVPSGQLPEIMSPDTAIEYEVPTTYTPPASKITVRGFFGSVTRGLMDLFAGKANKSDALQTLEQISANTDSNKIAGAAALKELNNNMNSKLSKLPAKILYGSGLYNIDGSGVVRIPVAGISSGVPMVIIKSAYVQIGNCGYDGTSIFVQLYINNGAGVPSPGQVYADYIIVGK